MVIEWHSLWLDNVLLLRKWHITWASARSSTKPYSFKNHRKLTMECFFTDLNLYTKLQDYIITVAHLCSWNENVSIQCAFKMVFSSNGICISNRIFQSLHISRSALKHANCWCYRLICYSSCFWIFEQIYWIAHITRIKFYDLQFESIETIAKFSIIKPNNNYHNEKTQQQQKHAF